MTAITTSFRPLVQTSAFLRKETMTIIRQPVLLLVLVLGPFLLLSLFAAGFDQQQTVLRTAFVGPEGQGYEQSAERFTGDLQEYVSSAGYSTDLVETRQRLEDGEIDLIVVFPSDPGETVLDGEQAVITVLHDKLDPIQQTAVEVSVRVAVQELNAIVVESAISELQGRLDALPQEELQEAAEADPDTDDTAELLDYSETVTTIDPAIVARPFSSDTENLLRSPVTLIAYVAPAAIALLIQHMAATFAALGLVRDRALGLFEVYRVGPISAGRILLGKYLSHLILSGAIMAALVALSWYVVGVPFRGELFWVIAGSFGLITSSIAAGLVLALLAKSDTQAVQYSMMLLLAGLFFSGFLLDLNSIRYPVRVISLSMPVTYATRLLRDVMLRGAAPDPGDVAGLVALSLVLGALAWWLLRRRLRLR